MRTIVLTLFFISCGYIPHNGKNQKQAVVADTDPDAQTDESESQSETEQTETPIDISQVGSVSQFARLVATAAEAPDCNQKNHGVLIYIADQSQFAYCSPPDWLPIEIKGKDGSDGAAGKDGDKTLPWLFDADGKSIGYIADPSLITDIPFILDNGLPAYAASLAKGFSGALTETSGRCFYESTDCTGQCWSVAESLGGIVFTSGGTDSANGTVTIGSPESIIQKDFAAPSRLDAAGACVTDTAPTSRTYHQVKSIDYPLPWTIQPRVFERNENDQ